MKSVLSDKSHTFVIAEAGSNWKSGSFEEDLMQAKKLIDVASEAGADAIKFQTYRAETVYVPGAGKSSYLSEHGINKNINDIFEYLSMPYEMIPKLKEYCDRQHIMFMSTPFSVKDAKKLDPYVEIHKVASYEINHIRLIEYLVSTKKPLIVSTGASTMEEIDFLISILKKNNHTDFSLMQCTSKYPAPLSSLNLSVIPKLAKKYSVPVGLSDHSMDPLVGPLVAIGYGATIIEKHFTIDRNLPGPDHPFALIPEELNRMVKYIRLADEAKGTGIKEVLEVEKELREYATRSLQAIKNIKKGELLEEGKNFEVLRPGNKTKGLQARFLNKVNGKRATSDIETGEGILDYE